MQRLSKKALKEICREMSYDQMYVMKNKSDRTLYQQAFDRKELHCMNPKLYPLGQCWWKEVKAVPCCVIALCVHVVLFLLQLFVKSIDASQVPHEHA